MKNVSFRVANAYTRVCQTEQLAHARREGGNYPSVSVDCRSGSSCGEVDWWLVKCHLVEKVRRFGEISSGVPGCLVCMAWWSPLCRLLSDEVCKIVICSTFGCSCCCNRSVPHTEDRRPLFRLRRDAVKIEERLCKVKITQGHTAVAHWPCHLVQPGVQKSPGASTTS